MSELLYFLSIAGFIVILMDLDKFPKDILVYIVWLNMSVSSPNADIDSISHDTF